MKKTLIAFTGEPIKQRERIAAISDGFECWNLKRFTLIEFVAKLKEKISPINDNVLKNYRLEQESRDIYGITDKQYALCSWALLIAEGRDDAIVSNFAESMMLINLYSPAFLYPIFYASDFGITRVTHGKPLLAMMPWQNQAAIFKTKSFVSFFKELLPQSQYGVWQRGRCEKWDEEDWRLFVAMLLFSGLQDYGHGKNPFSWQRESADMATLLECLFTAQDSQNEEVGYRLRKGVAVLLGTRFPDVEARIKDMYRLRSGFVHGSFFAGLAKRSKRNFSNLPLPDFGLLGQHKEYVRWASVAYLGLARIIKTEAFPGFGRVIDLLEAAIIDVDLRKRITLETGKIFRLMPKPERGAPSQGARKSAGAQNTPTSKQRMTS
ncbi:MAG: hypothetical protein ACLQBA_08830 [Candidatus Binataceae bacterium]